MVRYPAGRATRPDYTQLPPGHRTCSFICNLKLPGSTRTSTNRHMYEYRYEYKLEYKH